MKSVTRWLIYTLLVLGVCVVALEGTVAFISRTQWFNAKVDRAVEQALGREIKLGRIGANLSGVFIQDVQIASPGGFKENVFASAKRLRIGISPLHLLHGHIAVKEIVFSNISVNLAINKDGSTNWDDWAASLVKQQEQETSSDETDAVPLNITAVRLRLEQLGVSFMDYRTERVLELDNINLEVRNFSLEDEFSLTFWANFYHKEANFEKTIPIILQAKIYLNQLNLEGAYADIDTLKALHQKSSVMLAGRVADFMNPQVNLTLTASRLSSGLFEGLGSVPEFSLDKATGTLEATVNMQDKRAVLKQIALQAPGLDVTGKGSLSYAKNLQYQFDSTITAVLGEIGRWFTALANSYRLVGNVAVQTTVTQEKITGQVNLQEVGGFVEQVGQFSNMNGEISGWEAMNFKSGQLQTKLDGKFEANPFSVSLTAKQTPQKIVADLKAFAKEIRWNGAEQDKQVQQENPASSLGEESSSPKSSWPLPPIDLKADVNVEKLDVPYFYGNRVAFDADVQGLTPSLKQTHGSVHLQAEDGQIRDIYKLTNANALTKVLFMSLNVTGKVFNSLNVFGVLKSLGGGIASVVTGNSKQKAPETVKMQTILGPDGEPLEVPVVEVEQDSLGEMDYDKLDTLVNFQEGEASIKRGTFVSPAMSLRLDGTTNFNTGVVDLTVRAAPGRHEVDGMMPLTLKIGGTLDDPKGNMQLLSSVTSLVTQSVTNNVVSRGVKKGIKGFFGLFQRDEEPAPQVAD